MDFNLTDEQSIIKSMLDRYMDERFDFETRMKFVRCGDDGGLWNDFAQTLGITGAPLPEAVGGLGGGAVEAMIVMEALGRALVPVPWLETVVMAGGLLGDIGGDLAHSVLETIVSGEARPVFAHAEGFGLDRSSTLRTVARADGDGWIISGQKTGIVGAPQAEQYIVSARIEADGDKPAQIGLFLIRADAGGVTRTDYRHLDESWASDIEFDDVRVSGNRRLGEDADVAGIIEKTMDRGTAALCAEAVGLIKTLLADTVDYTKQREQFGQALSSFQALQHRMVNMYIEQERAISASYLATLNLDSEPLERARAVSAAKAVIGDALRFVGQNAVQLHGAMGMTQELRVGHYFKRATVIERQFGSKDDHLARYAKLGAAAAA